MGPPIAAAIGIDADDVYKTKFTQDRIRQGKKVDPEHNVYNAPEMYYQLTIPIVRKRKTRVESVLRR